MSEVNLREIVDDCSPPSRAAKLRVRLDPQGDLYFTIVGADGKRSETVRLCGPGGGSQNEGLATKLTGVLFKP